MKGLKLVEQEFLLLLLPVVCLFRFVSFCLVLFGCSFLKVQTQTIFPVGCFWGGIGSDLLRALRLPLNLVRRDSGTPPSTPSTARRGNKNLEGVDFLEFFFSVPRKSWRMEKTTMEQRDINYIYYAITMIYLVWPDFFGLDSETFHEGNVKKLSKEFYVSKLYKLAILHLNTGHLAIWDDKIPLWIASHLRSFHTAGDWGTCVFCWEGMACV